MSNKTAYEWGESGRVQFELGNYIQAIHDYTQAIELAPGDDQPYIQRGLAYLQSEQYEKAVKDFTKGINLNPNPDAMIYYFRGVAYSELGENDTEHYTQAIKDFTQMIELNPMFAEAYRYRGFVYRQIGDAERAVKGFNKFLELIEGESNIADTVREWIRELGYTPQQK